jgi:alginate O-acetyltransferase complex protein AlgJ
MHITDKHIDRRSPPVWIDRLLVLCFVAFIVTPAISLPLRFGQNTNRVDFDRLHSLPKWSWSARTILHLPQDFREVFNENFPFRASLTRAHFYLKVACFGVNNLRNVMLGRDGWLFFSGEQIVDDYRRARPFSQDDLASWVHLLTTRRDWLRSRGIPYIFFIAPNPQSIYSEEMPGELWRAANPSRLDQLMNYVRAHADLDIIDPRAALLAAKPTMRVYYRTDTHWNQLGGFIVYQQLAGWLTQRLSDWRVDSAEDFDVVYTPEWHGGLSYMLGVPELFSEPRVDLVPRGRADVLSNGRPMPQDETTDAWNIRSVVVRETANGEVPRAVIFRDSQMAAPAQFISHHFGRLVLIWQPTFDPNVVVKEHPNVVIQEMVERSLMGEIPVDPPLSGEGESNVAR